MEKRVFPWNIGNFPWKKGCPWKTCMSMDISIHGIFSITKKNQNDRNDLKRIKSINEVAFDTHLSRQIKKTFLAMEKVFHRQMSIANFGNGFFSIENIFH